MQRVLDGFTPPQRGGHAKEVQELAEHTNAPARPPVLEHGSLKLSEVVRVRLLMLRAESFEAVCEEGVLAMQAGRFQRLLLDVVLPGLLFIEDFLMLHDTPDVERAKWDDREAVPLLHCVVPFCMEQRVPTFSRQRLTNPRIVFCVDPNPVPASFSSFLP